MTRAELPFVATGEDEVEVTNVDLGVARALWDGVPVARLLARIRLHRDERDLVDVDLRASGVQLDESSWDLIVARLLAAAPVSLDRLKRAVARHTRPASDEGPLAATDAAIAALVHAHLSAIDVDASAAEGAGEAAAVEEPVALACARIDERLGRTPDASRAAYFDACLELAKRGASSAWPLDALRTATGALAVLSEASTQDSGAFPRPDALPDVLLASEALFYPWGDDGVVPPADRRACLLDRGALERVLVRPERDVAAAIARAEARYPGLPIAKIAAELRPCVQKHGALVLVATREPRSQREAPRLPPASWAPVDLDSNETAPSIASALERGSLTAPRARSILLRGGDRARDAIGKEMLDVAAHPFASSVFAELLAPFARERDVVRLVAYFAMAPDPSTAARALDLCPAREVVATMLKAWLETMLPADGAMPPVGGDPATSPSARIALCVAALRPYPALYDAVAPLLARTHTPTSA